MCSSPRLIAAYHVLLRLLEPRHPPCALICFKNSQIFTCLTTRRSKKISLSKSYSVCYNFFPICQRTLSVTRRAPLPGLVNVLDSNQMTCPLFRLKSHCVKELHSLLRIEPQAVLNGANVFERTLCVRGGGCRSRTDDPLLAKQVL